MNWYVFFWFLGAMLATYMIYNLVRNKPDWFSAKAFFKTMNTLGFLAIMLMAVIAFCVMMLKAG